MYILLACLRNFEINSVIIISDDLDGIPYTIGYIEDLIPNLLDDNDFRNYLGSDQTIDLQKNPVATLVSNNRDVEDSKILSLLSDILVNLETFSSAMWFVKDNAVNPSFAIMFDTEKQLASSNRRNTYLSNAIGSYESATFNKGELEEAFNIYKLLLPLLQRVTIEDIHLDEGYQPMSNFLDPKLPSFSRALLLLNSARNSEFLPAKIANYISVLECLMAAKGENTQKVSERAACFIAENTTERIKIFNDVKDCYQVRSDYVHGSEIKGSKHSQMPEISFKLDDIVRRVLKKMYTNHPELNYNNSNKKDTSRKNLGQVDQWFDELVLSRE